MAENEECTEENESGGKEDAAGLCLRWKFWESFFFLKNGSEKWM